MFKICKWLRKEFIKQKCLKKKFVYLNLVSQIWVVIIKASCIARHAMKELKFGNLSKHYIIVLTTTTSYPKKALFPIMILSGTFKTRHII